jgi:FkbM family methyltransferase
MTPNDRGSSLRTPGSWARRLLRGGYGLVSRYAWIQRLIDWSGVRHFRAARRWLGLSSALQLFFWNLLGIQKILKVRLRGSDRPVFIRAHTSDFFVYREIFELNIYRSALPAQVRTIVDAGANIGLTSVFFAQQYPSARIVAIEPAAENLRVFLRNLADYPNVRCLQAGLWPRAQPLRIINPDGAAWAFEVRPCAADESDFAGVTIPQVMTELGSPTIDLLKIDIEGAEWPLFFDSSPDWLRQVNLLMVELHARQKGARTLQELAELASSYGLTLSSFGEDVAVFVRPAPTAEIPTS